MRKKRDKRDELISLIPGSCTTVMDVGCGNGTLGGRICKKGKIVIGVEKEASLCKEAQKKITRVFHADAVDFSPPFAHGHFDCIFYADILEHFLEPLCVLRRHALYLNEKGCVVASIPNIRYYKVITRLAFKGTWDYVEKGILDKTHLRFFTLITIKELFAESGYRITEIRRNIVASRGLRLLNVLCFGRLVDLLTYQYYIKAQKARGTEAAVPPREVSQF